MKRASRAKGKSGKAAKQPPAAPRVVILAAGAGSRLRTTLPKILHRVGGRTLIEAVLDAADSVSPAKTVVVLGASRALVEPALRERNVAVVVQDPPLGTGDAARAALSELSGSEGPVLVLSGDVPLLTPETLRALLDRQAAGRLDLAFLSFRPPDPSGFGRVVRGRGGRVTGVVEEKSASAREKAIPEVNAGVYCFSSEALPRALAGVKKNRASGEYYLTDAVGILAAGDGRVEAVEAADWREAWGVNTRRDLAAAEEIERRRSLDRALDAGATLVDPSTIRIGPRVVVEPDVVIHPFVSLEGRTRLAEASEILPFTRILDSSVAERAMVGPHCDVEGAVIGPRARVGPFARLRPGTVLEEDVRVGNFVETKNAHLERGAKASHLTYLGDTEIGADANIGAGVITCNYDGERKHRTAIGAGAFIGSGSQLVAPVTIGEGAYVGAGSTITRDVPAGALAVTRAPQETREDWVARRKKKGKTG